MEKHGLVYTTVKIKLRWPDFTTLTRQTTLDQPTGDSSLIYPLAEKLFFREWLPGKYVRLIGVGVSGLLEGQRQIGLWDVQVTKERQLQETVNKLRTKYGEDVIGRGLPKDDHQ